MIIASIIFGLTIAAFYLVWQERAELLKSFHLSNHRKNTRLEQFRSDFRKPLKIKEGKKRKPQNKPAGFEYNIVEDE